MPNRSGKQARDVNQLAKTIVEQATSEDQPEDQAEAQDHNAIAKILGRLGGLKGGPAHAAALLPEERKKIAKKAAEATWKKRSWQ